MKKNVYRVRLLLALACCLFASGAAFAQTYTTAELEAEAPLPWQVHSDPVARLTIGNDDGYATASPHATAFASVIRWGGAHGLRGLLDEFAISTEGAPAAFGLGRSDCAVTDEASLDACIPVRWQPSAFFGAAVMEAVVKTPSNTSTFLVYDVQPGDIFSIERDGLNTIRFYRSTGTPGERQRIGSLTSPFTAADAQYVVVRAAFTPAAATRKIVAASERYYCCL